MKVLIGCEESQAMCKAFRALGHEAFSCDLQECSGGHPEWHIQGDIMQLLMSSLHWDRVILHPDCTAMALSGNRWYGRGMPRHKERLDAIAWTVMLWNTAKDVSDGVVLENPASVIFQHLDADDVQYIQPWMFGHGECKKTGLALHNVSRLVPTNIVQGREQRIWKMAPSPERKKNRSKTFPGVAKAFAEQIGGVK